MMYFVKLPKQRKPVLRIVADVLTEIGKRHHREGHQHYDKRVSSIHTFKIGRYSNDLP